jgi:PAS domain S-box-containing protein
MEAALQESEAKVRKVTETVAAKLFIYQRSHFRYVDPMLETMTGYRQDEVLATEVWELIHPDWQEAFKGHEFARQQGDAVPAFDELELVTKGGEQRWVHATMSPVEFEGEFA